MHKRWVYRSNSKLHLIDMKIGMYVKSIYKMWSNVRFSKFEYDNKLLVGVTFFKVTSSVTWT